MATSKEVSAVVNRFLDDVRALMQQAQGDHQSAMLGAVGSLLGSPQASAKRPAPTVKPKRRVPATAKPAPSPPAEAPALAGPRRRHPRLIAVRAEGTTSASPPKSRNVTDATEKGELPSPPKATAPSVDRKAEILEAVRVLVRPTVAEVAKHCGVPSHTVYVVLQSLLATAQVARTRTGREDNYSLVSGGGIRPIKRTKNVPPPPEPGENVTF